MDESKVREAMKQALEAAYLAGFNDSAEGYNGEYPFRDNGAAPTNDRYWVDRRDGHIAALRQALIEDQHSVNKHSHALEQPADEPVAWRWKDVDGYETIMSIKPPHDAEPLYTRPQPAAQWVWLTDEELHKLWRESPFRGSGGQMDWFTEGARVAEAKLREKNGGLL